MRKFILSILFVVLANSSVIAQNFDFTKSGEEASNNILKEYISAEIEGFRGDVVSYFYDIDNDNKKEIIGIVKSRSFYTIEGYNLVVLEETPEGWQMLPTNIFFDETKPFDITDSKISYSKNSFKGNKKVTEKKNSNYKAAASIKSYYTSRKIRGIEETINIGEGHPSIEVNVNDFPPCEQESFEIQYPTEYEKPKYRIDIY